MGWRDFNNDCFYPWCGLSVYACVTKPLTTQNQHKDTKQTSSYKASLAGVWTLLESYLKVIRTDWLRFSGVSKMTKTPRKLICKLGNDTFNMRKSVWWT